MANCSISADYRKLNVRVHSYKMTRRDTQGLTVLHDPTVPSLVGEKGLPLDNVVYEYVSPTCQENM